MLKVEIGVHFWLHTVLKVEIGIHFSLQTYLEVEIGVPILLQTHLEIKIGVLILIHRVYGNGNRNSFFTSNIPGSRNWSSDFAS